VLLSTARVKRREEFEYELRERRRLLMDFAKYVEGLVKSYHRLLELARPNLWVLKGELLGYIREVGWNALLARETLKKLKEMGVRLAYDEEAAVHYLDKIVSGAKELTGAVDQLERDGDYVRVSPDVASLVERIGRNVDIVFDIYRQLYRLL
jgi:hypothetical protein